jgi:putative endonuclease
MSKQYYFYLMTSKKDGVIYAGVTGDLIKRVYEHKNNFVKGFTEKYFVHRLVYFEIFNDPKEAIKREKLVKRWKREWKVDLIESNNSDWLDLFDTII